MSLVESLDAGEVTERLCHKHMVFCSKVNRILMVESSDAGEALARFFPNLMVLRSKVESYFDG